MVRFLCEIRDHFEYWKLIGGDQRLVTSVALRNGDDAGAFDPESMRSRRIVEELFSKGSARST